MVVQIKSLGLIGIEAYDVSVETDITRGMSSFDIVGLPDASVKEARERVRSAIGNCGFEFPKKRVVINLAPADIKKTGSYYDLPILISILVATSQRRSALRQRYSSHGHTGSERRYPTIFCTGRQCL